MSDTATSPTASASRAASLTLLLGNFFIGLSILAPAGMVGELAASFSVTVPQAALLITAGAVVLCVGSPIVASITNAIDRRLLLTASLTFLAFGHFASMIAPTLAVLVGVRMASMAAAAIFTPQAASTIGMMVPEAERPGAISFIFSGWSLSVAVGLPLVSWLASLFGWQMIHAGLGVGAALAAVFVWFTLPSGLRSVPMSLVGWKSLLRNRLVLLLVLATAVAASGQFMIFTYFGPLLTHLVSADATTIAMLFAVFGISGFVGNLAASAVVQRLGAYRTSLLFFGVMAVGSLVWALGAGMLPVMIVGSLLWGLGFASSNSMQQARLAGTVPALAGAAIALNSSAIYVGQALGSAAGGVFFDAHYYVAVGFAAFALLALTLGIVALTRPAPQK
jgi:DHA1 family inner membrane transport protein